MAIELNLSISFRCLREGHTLQDEAALKSLFAAQDL
jgi:hypothetical protein